MITVPRWFQEKIKKIQPEAARSKMAMLYFNPTSRLSWLANRPVAVRLRWPFNRRQTIVVSIGLGIFLLIAILMIWPILPAAGPAGLVYLFHDEIVLPVRGRVFERYEPVPQLFFLVLLVGALFAVFGRRHIDRIHGLATEFCLSFPQGQVLLQRWVTWRGGDSYLLVQAERMHRAAVAKWLGNRSANTVKAVLDLGSQAIFLLAASKPSRRVDAVEIALAQVSTRQFVLQTLSGVDVFNTDILDQHAGPICQMVSKIVSKKENAGVLEKRLWETWYLVERSPPSLRAAGTEALTWAALLISLQQGDGYVLRMCLSLRARTAFDHDKKGQEVPALEGQILFDPIFWDLVNDNQAGTSTLGAGLTQAEVADLRMQLDAKPMHRATK